MKLRKYRWTRKYEPDEDDLTVYLSEHNIEATCWLAEPEQVYEDHAHAYDKRLWCAEGAISFYTSDMQHYSLLAGDALDIPAGTMHRAVAGIGGCVCYEQRLS